MSIRYAEPDYWDARYQREPALFEWFFGHTALRRIIRAYLSKKKPVLHVGCGTSNLQEGLAKSGYTIINTDISEVVIKQMRERHAQYSNMTYVKSDCRNMPEFLDCQFGNVIDKGTMDALLCCKQGTDNVQRMLQEICRVLQPGGVFLLVTLGSPPQRLPLLIDPRLPWKVTLLLLPKIPAACQAYVDGKPINDSIQPIDPEGPYEVLDRDTIAGLPAGIQFTNFFYAFVCKKHPLQLPSGQGQKGQLPNGWVEGSKELFQKLQKELGLPEDLLVKGRRKRTMHVPAGSAAGMMHSYSRPPSSSSSRANGDSGSFSPCESNGPGTGRESQLQLQQMVDQPCAVVLAPLPQQEQQQQPALAAVSAAKPALLELPSRPQSAPNLAALLMDGGTSAALAAEAPGAGGQQVQATAIAAGSSTPQGQQSGLAPQPGPLSSRQAAAPCALKSPRVPATITLPLPSPQELPLSPSPATGTFSPMGGACTPVAESSSSCSLPEVLLNGSSGSGTAAAGGAGPANAADKLALAAAVQGAGERLLQVVLDSPGGAEGVSGDNAVPESARSAPSVTGRDAAAAAAAAGTDAAEQGVVPEAAGMPAAAATAAAARPRSPVGPGRTPRVRRFSMESGMYGSLLQPQLALLRQQQAQHSERAADGLVLHDVAGNEGCGGAAATAAAVATAAWGRERRRRRLSALSVMSGLSIVSSTSISECDWEGSDNGEPSGAGAAGAGGGAGTGECFDEQRQQLLMMRLCRSGSGGGSGGLPGAAGLAREGCEPVLPRQPSWQQEQEQGMQEQGLPEQQQGVPEQQQEEGGNQDQEQYREEEE